MWVLAYSDRPKYQVTPAPKIWPLCALWRSTRPEGALAVIPPPRVVEMPVTLPLPIVEGAVFAGLGYWLWRRSLRRAV